MGEDRHRIGAEVEWRSWAWKNRPGRLYSRALAERQKRSVLGG